jgi:hypothetical protein
VPREVFVATGDRGHAYRDSARHRLRADHQPASVAYMTEQLQRGRTTRCSRSVRSGYQAAVLSRLCAHVLTIERYRTLADTAATGPRLGYFNIEVMFGDGFDIPPGAGDFDRIIVTAAMEKKAAGAASPVASDRTGRPRIIHPDAGRVTRPRAVSAQVVDVRFVLACGYRAGTVEIRIGCSANVLFPGLSGCLLGRCLLKTVICCVRVSNHVPCRRVASLASGTAGRGADADVGWLCRLQRRYADALFRQLLFQSLCLA